MTRKSMFALLTACLLVGTVLTAVIARGQQPADDSALAEPIQQCETFLEKLPAGVDEAYRALLLKSPLELEKKKLAKIVDDTRRLLTSEAVYGKPRKDPFERVKSQRIASDVALLRYVYKFENLPVVWYFTFDRVGERWVLITVRFDHEYELLGL